MGKCPYCGEWNSYEEKIEVKKTSTQSGKYLSQDKINPVSLAEIEQVSEKRIKTISEEFNRVLGGGVVEGEVILLAGEPGVGKSTLLLQIALSNNTLPILYVAGEESLLQIKLRAGRLNVFQDNTTLFTTEKNVEQILNIAKEKNSGLVIIDSIQTVYASDNDFLPGSVSQIRASTQKIIEFAKETGTAFILVGHINKDGAVAGPKVLEHMVDAVFNFEGDRNLHYRLLRPIKNRFGATTELGVFEMQSNGLREVTNPSEFLMNRTRDESGIAIATIVEGHRIFFIEIQALVTPSVYGSPQRVVTGYDPKKLNMLLAVLEKRNKFKLGNKDVFLNIAGGLKVTDTAADLAVVAALVSSYIDKPIQENVVFAGEVGLSGEIRPVKRLQDRINEADKLGYKTFVLANVNNNIRDILKNKKIHLIFVEKTFELFQKVFRY